MKHEDVLALLNEPACAHNNKSKSGCAEAAARRDPGRLLFRRRAQRAAADRGRRPHRAWPDRLRRLVLGQSRHTFERRGHLPHRHDDRSFRNGRHHGPRREAALPRHPAGGRDLQARRGVRLQHLRSRPAGRRHRGRREGRVAEVRRGRRARGLRGLLRQQEPRQPHRRRRHL